MFKQMSFAVLLLLAVGQIANGQSIHFGKCANVSHLETFEWEKYVGTWYEYAKYPFVYEFAQKCQTARYAAGENNTISVHNTGISIITGKLTEIEGFAKVLGAGKLAVVFSPNQSEKEANYEVLGTDYDNYAVVYSSKKLPLICIEFLWVLTRERIPSNETVAAAYKVIKDNKISTTMLFKTDQKDCPAQ